MTGQAVNSSENNSSSGSLTNTNSQDSNSNTSSSGSSISTPSITLNNGSNRNNQNNISSFNARGVSIIADSSQNSLVVKAEPQLMREIEAAIQQLDVRREQVLIEAAIIEVAGDDADQLM